MLDADNLISEVRLWRAVLCQAVRDATVPDHLVSSRSGCGHVANVRERSQARTFIFNSDYFYTICFHADVEPECVKDLTNKIIEMQRLLTPRGIYFMLWNSRVDWLWGGRNVE